MKQHIALVGKEVLPVYYAIKKYGPDNVFFICSDDTIATAERIESVLPKSIHSEKIIVNPYSLREVGDACSRIHTEYPGDYLYNLTGGTKPMAFAAYDVAKTQHARCIYTTQQNIIVSLDTYDETPFDLELDNLEILNLSGNKVLSYEPIESLSPQIIKGAKEVMVFQENYKTMYEKHQRYLANINKNRDTDSLPSRYKLSDGASFEKIEEGFCLKDIDDNVLLNLPFAFSFALFFQGRWWETVVADKIIKWNRKYAREIWQSVVFSTKSKKEVAKNEIDILINNQSKLITVECKSGKVLQTDIYKIDAIRETYGGEMSQAVLVSYYPIGADLRDKCKELQIHVCAPNYCFEKDFLNRLPKQLDQIVVDVKI